MNPSIPANPGRIARYIDMIIHLRWVVLLVSILGALGVGTGAANLKLANDYRVFFGADNPDLLAFETIEKTFSKNDNVLLVIQPESGSVFTPRTLGMIRELTDAAWQTPFSTRVDSLTNFQHTEAEGDDLLVEDLYPPEASTRSDADRARAIALAEPALVHRLVHANERTAGINIRIELDASDDTSLPLVAAYVRQLRDEFTDTYPDHTIGLTGLSMLNNAFAESPMRDAPLVMPLMFFTLTAAMILFLRSITGTLATLVVIMLATIAALGIFGHIDGGLDPISAAAPVIILTLAVADSIHVLVSYFGLLREGAAKRAALVQAFEINAKPVFLTSLTTVVGFLSLNTSDSPPYQVLGNVSALGVALAWLFSMTTLPALLAIIPARGKAGWPVLTALAQRTGDFVVRRARFIALGLGGATIVLVASIATLGINDKFVEYFDQSLTFRQDTDFSIENLSGIYTVSYSIPADGSQGVSEPEYLTLVDGLANFLRTQPGVVHVNTFTDTMKRLNKNMHGDDESYHRLPDSRELGAQFLLLYEMNLPYGLDVNDQIDIDKSALRVNVTFGDVDSVDIDAVHANAMAWLEQRDPATTRSTLAGSTSLMFGNITERNIKGLAVGTGLGFLVIAVILAVSLGSLRIGAVSLIPNVLPAAMAFGIWAWLYGEVGFAISAVAGLSIGIIVDDTVHFLVKYRRARGQLGYDASDAVRYAFQAVGPAILGTTLIVAGGFAMLGLSTFRVTSYMGLLTSLAVMCAMITDFFLLPALLVLLDKGTVGATVTTPSETEGAIHVDESQLQTT